MAKNTADLKLKAASFCKLTAAGQIVNKTDLGDMNRLDA